VTRQEQDSRNLVGEIKKLAGFICTATRSENDAAGASPDRRKMAEQTVWVIGD
jgi:hypothetical protein